MARVGQGLLGGLNDPYATQREYERMMRAQQDWAYQQQAAQGLCAAPPAGKKADNAVLLLLDQPA